MTDHEWVLAAQSAIETYTKRWPMLRATLGGKK